jgi:hypothetical protein
MVSLALAIGRTYSPHHEVATCAVGATEAPHASSSTSGWIGSLTCVVSFASSRRCLFEQVYSSDRIEHEQLVQLPMSLMDATISSRTASATERVRHSPGRGAG